MISSINSKICAIKAVFPVTNIFNNSADIMIKT